MYHCQPCDRWFNNEHAYDQHIDNSPAHNFRGSRYECSVCDRGFSTEYSLHQHSSTASGHPYCIPCKRMFMNQNNLNQHMHSRTHVGSQIQCPFCRTGYATASGVTIQLESGNCPQANIDRHGINRMIRRLDTNHVITRRLLTYGDTDPVEYIATERSWNGHAFQCVLCTRQFGALHSLNTHMKSPVHEQNLYHCPGRNCAREYKLLSGLVQHVESESCGVMRFAAVQQQARNGIENMVGRMIQGA
ncbi:uncharacterized protein LY89DRAFT_597106 [Mollisia scopiformis]|uniref:C2H2-type domain-containing protein n=1 Tax=Mollisia scopiformis TaxID=149040 RepID=A0A132BC03_MOLSC|nr:uncharacterized protein LY89DRAFT_597106 [Mollisia scopiformis]KUJ09926.1 hypothetical protein LY89DRAFT_597106 [Mollisia scopiformis]